MLAVEELRVEFTLPNGTVVSAVNGVSYYVMPEETLAVVGESGSGKSVSALAIMGLLRGGRVVSGRAAVDGVDLMALPETSRRRRLGSDVAMIFQNPSAALNPVMRVGDQIVEALKLKDETLSAKEAHCRAMNLLAAVGVPEPEARLRQYPHQFSGGMCQRVVIAIAMANKPKVLIADEPTTAVDVTIQAQLLDLIELAKAETGASTVLITHDLGVVAQIADRVAVMYAGRIVETASVHDIFAQPRHPYTRALLSSLPPIDREVDKLDAIPGQPPDLAMLPPGCPFQPRCPIGQDKTICGQANPALAPLSQAAGSVACHFPLGLEAREEPRMAGEACP